jgi:hypothetical protein
MITANSLEFVFQEKLLDGEHHVREYIVMVKKLAVLPQKLRPFLSQRFSQMP